MHSLSRGVHPASPRAQHEGARVIKTSVEYVGFRNTADRREYLLRSHTGTEIRAYTIGIELDAFTRGQVRLQDGPEISYLKLQKELDASESVLEQDDFTVSDVELLGYRTAHTHVPASRRAVAPATPVAPQHLGPDRGRP
jgi:hypothetical protein